MLSALAAIVILAQAAPEAASSAAPAQKPAAVSASSASETKTLPQIEVIRQRELADEIAKRSMVCVDEKLLGSILPKKMCATKEELADRKNVDQAEVRRTQALRPYKVN